MAILQSLAEALTIIQQLMPLDCSACLCDAEGTIITFVPPKTFSFYLKVGDKVSPGGSLAECLQTGEINHKIIPAGVYEFTCKAISVPLREGGKLVGGISVGLNLATQDNLIHSARTITSTAEEIAAATQELATSAQMMAATVMSLKEIGGKVCSGVSETDSILRFVSDVAANSNLLGLNAAIEAARAGETGRGFTVVADEMRKMAQNSETAVKAIKAILVSIDGNSKKMISAIGDTMSLGERQSAATQEIAASMQQLLSVATDVEKVAEIV